MQYSMELTPLSFSDRFEEMEKGGFWIAGQINTVGGGPAQDSPALGSICTAPNPSLSAGLSLFRASKSSCEDAICVRADRNAH